jgi:RND superfamily putative drug exporter
MWLTTTSLARSSARHPWAVIGLWGLALAGAIAVIFLVLPGALTAQYSFLNDPDSKVGRELLLQRMDLPAKANEVIIVRSSSATAADPAFRAAVLSLQERIDGLGPGVVDSVASPYLGGDGTLISADQRTVILPIVMAGGLTTAEENIDKVHAIVGDADGENGLDTLITGTASIGSDFSEQAGSDLRRGETIGGSIALVILLIVFGAVVAATLPLFLGIVAITLSVALTVLIGQAFDLSVFAINMISMMGLATGIDYSLFIVSRYREERAHGRDKIDAITVTGGTASRAVFFSGMTVVLALLGMLIVPTNLFISLAVGAIVVVAMAVIGALTLLPAVLSLLGDRVNGLKVPYLGKRLLAGQAAGRPSLLARLAQRAMRRPALALSVGVGIMVLAALPALSMRTGVAGVGTFPDRFESKQAFGVLDREFSAAGRVSPVEIVVDGEAGSSQVQAAIARLQDELVRDGSFGPPQVQVAESGNLALISVPVAGEASSDLAIEKVRELRSELVPVAFAGSGAAVYVTGETGGTVDYIDIVNTYFPWVVALVLGLSFLLLMVAFRSLVVPALSIVMNLLSVAAAYGLITLVSLQGYGAELFGFQQVDTIEQWVPLFLFSVLFGLSMDYQVFLLSRIKEEHDRGAGNRAAVISGIGSTAGIITGAALIMVAVFAGVASGDLVMFQQMGFGLAVAVLLDATVVRTLLVPAAMSLLGEWNWYLPRWLSWLPHFGVEGGAAPALGSRSPAGAERSGSPEGGPAADRGSPAGSAACEPARGGAGC